MKKLKRDIIIAGIILMILFMLFFSFVQRGIGNSSFKTDSVFLKTVLKPNGTYSGNVRVTNLANSQSFNVFVRGVNNLVGIDAKNFEIEKQGTRDINLLFSNSGGAEPGIYTGTLEIVGDGEKKAIPIIVEVESEEVLFDGNLALFPTEKIFAGDKINVEIKIFDLSKIGISSVDMKYFIKNFRGETLFMEAETSAVKDNVLVNKALNIPANLPSGDYMFGAVIKYRGSVGTSSLFYTVERKNKFEEMFLKNWIYIVSGMGAVAAIILILLAYDIYSRRKFYFRVREHAQESHNRRRKGA